MIDEKGEKKKPPFSDCCGFLKLSLNVYCIKKMLQVTEEVPTLGIIKQCMTNLYYLLKIIIQKPVKTPEVYGNEMPKLRNDAFNLYYFFKKIGKLSSNFLEKIIYLISIWKNLK